jgi:hypothetical protein
MNRDTVGVRSHPRQRDGVIVTCSEMVRSTAGSRPVIEAGGLIENEVCRAQDPVLWDIELACE